MLDSAPTDVSDYLSGPALRAFLTGALPAADVDTLAADWRWTTISLLLSGDFSGLTGADVARRTRGALWPVLEAEASPEAAAGAPCPRRPLSLLDLLWNEQGHLTRARAIPKPFVLRGHVDTVGGAQRAIVQMVLIGLAGAFAARTIQCLQRAFARGVGPARHAAPWRLDDVELVHERGAGTIDGDVSAAELELLSPLELRRDAVPARDWTGLLPALIDRIDGLALWQGYRLDAAFGPLKAHAREIHVDSSATDRQRVERRSTRLDRSAPPIPREEMTGRLTLIGPLTPLVPYILLGEISHIGRDTRHGNGWFRAGFWADD